ncbi:MAG TPA: hypothetical protein VG104_01710 [Candidatus Dormibacteraeota bacterium]|nr:hypothetical protein [Candidatus Dormibacteraeota bacterium]
MNRADGGQPSLVTEVIGWLAFVLFVGAVWKLRQTIDRSDPGR